MNDIIIQPYNWNKKEYRIFSKSCSDILDIKEVQFYQPYFSLYFHIHNTKYSHKVIDIKKRFLIKKIINIESEKYYTSNLLITCSVHDTYKNSVYTQELFCKCIPLLDPICYIMNNYNIFNQRNHLLPSCYNHNTFSKINNINNSAYIDTFFSFICSELTLRNISPSFSILYSSFNGVKKKFSLDISEEYHSIKKEKWFYKNMHRNNIFLDVYMSSDSDNDSDSDRNSDRTNTSNGEYSSSNISYRSTDSNESSTNNDYIISLKDIPSQFFIIEKHQGTLDDFLSPIDTINEHLLLSCIFQITFALIYLQKTYHFTHNDLHINNIMYQKTERTYLYYKYNNIYYQVPTFGYIFKIIDFGRSIFTFHKKLFFNDTFEKHGEAEGQYSLPFNYLGFQKENETINQNFHFDLCRLAITILDTCNYDPNINYREKQQFIDFLHNMTLTKNGQCFLNVEDDFNLYIAISKYACNSLPKDIITNIIFEKYRIKKSKFPKKLYYTT